MANLLLKYNSLNVQELLQMHQQQMHSEETRGEVFRRPLRRDHHLRRAALPPHRRSVLPARRRGGSPSHPQRSGGHRACRANAVRPDAATAVQPAPAPPAAEVSIIGDLRRYLAIDIFAAASQQRRR